jgi:UDP-2,3-diacylglucosamine pyrophosphatase LpxH
MRQVYVISDLHLGGRYGNPDDPDDRGFRICTHVPALAEFVTALARKRGVELVVNGDLVDFLAEETEQDPHGCAFTQDPAAAVAKFDALVARDQVFFDALREFLAAGHKLVITLGNHDLELVLPQVRARLRDHLGDDGTRDFHFIHDGEAYLVGDALIEHGNRYDGFNVVNFNDLRQLRSLQSRRQPVPARWNYEAPPGSFMVTHVMNAIKAEYKFVDLLKPETGAVIPFLFALEPGYRKVLGEVAKIGLRARSFKLDEPALPAIGGDISSTGGGVDSIGGDLGGIGGDISSPGAPADDPLDKLLRAELGEAHGEFVAAVAPPAEDALGEDISAADTINRAVGLARLLFAKNDSEVRKRLPALLQSLRSLQGDRTFDRSVETEPAYLDAARDLARNGFKYVLFGHTHLAKDIEMDGGARYLNSGTWADLMRFPDTIVSAPEPEALARLGEFAGNLARNRIADLVQFTPTFIRLDVGDDGKVGAAALVDYTGPDSL